MITWPNNCLNEAMDALRFLAYNDRPRGGEELYNALHLIQLANELENAENERLNDLSEYRPNLDF